MSYILELSSSLAANLKMECSNHHLFLCEFTLSMRTTDSAKRKREEVTCGFGGREGAESFCGFGGREGAGGKTGVTCQLLVSQCSSSGVRRMNSYRNDSVLPWELKAKRCSSIFR